jgi:hypothetical protein
VRLRCSSVGACAAAGVTWTRRTKSAQWTARFGHSSVIDAAGAIYVIGGYSGGSGGSTYDDVWVSTDGGADRTRAGWSVGTFRVLTAQTFKTRTRPHTHARSHAHNNTAALRVSAQGLYGLSLLWHRAFAFGHRPGRARGPQARRGHS